MVSSREKGVEMQDYMINWNVGPLGLVLRPDLGTDMPPVVSQVLPGESVASLAGVSVGDMLVSVNGKKASKLGYEKAMKLLYKQKLPIILHFRIPQFKTMASDPYYQQHTPTGAAGMTLTPSGANAPHTPGAYHANASVSSHAPYQSSFIAQQQQQQQAQQAPLPPPFPQQPYPGQFMQYNQQQQQQQHQHQQQHQQQYQLHQHYHPSQSQSQSQSQPRPTTASSHTRGARTYSVLSTSTATREQKLRKQFSAVWESGSLGFSFRPYAPGVNIPTVDLIGARGQGKNMDQVCVNDVLIAINGENTKSLGVERVLKMLHVLEKPVVLRFHKSSHRIENPTAPPRLRRKSSAKLPAVVEKERELEEDDVEADDQGDMRGIVEEDGMPAVRFVDQIQLRSESRPLDESSLPPPPPPPPSAHTATPPSTPDSAHRRHPSRVVDHKMTASMRGEHQSPIAPTRQFATRSPSNNSASPPSASPSQPPRINLGAPSLRAANKPVYANSPPPSPAAPVTPVEPVRFPQEDDPDMEFPEPDDEEPENAEEIDESQLPHVPITIVGSVAPKRTSSSFVIPLEHAREIVAKSSGKPVELCQFGGVPLLQIKEGSVQARLLVTFAKACLAKQMKQLHDQDNGGSTSPSTQSPPKPPQPESAGSQQPPRTPSPQSSDNRSLAANAGSSYVPSNASTFAGNSLGPGNRKFLAYSFHQNQSHNNNSNNQNDGAPTDFVPSAINQSNSPDRINVYESYGPRRDLNLDAFASQRTVATRASSNGARTSSTDRSRSSNTSRSTTGSNTKPSMNQLEATAASVSSERASERSQSSAGGLTLSQLRVSDKMSASDVDPELHGMLKDLGVLRLPEDKEALPTRVTEMISLDSAAIEETKEEESAATTPPPSHAQPEQALVVVSAPEQTASPVRPSEVAAASAEREAEEEEALQSDHQELARVGRIQDSKTRHRKSSTTAHPNHPIIQSLCVGSRDLELVMVGREVDMILCKKHVVEEIQDILDSLEMELQFERHSHVGFGRGSIEDEPPVRCCSRCGKNGDIADLALDSERRELYCQNCWDVFFYREGPTMDSPLSSQGGRREPPEFDTPTDFDPFEYSLHDSIVNVADDFHPWRHLHFEDSSSERDSNVTQASSITSHADEVWL